MGEGADGLLTPEVCRAAAALLGGEAANEAELQARSAELLTALGYAPSFSGDESRNRCALLRLAGRFERLFAIIPPDSPNLEFVGGEVASGLAGAATGADGPVSLAGAGATFAQAFERCVGEGAEYLSQRESQADIVDQGPPEEVPHGLEPAALSAIVAMLPQSKDGDPCALEWVTGRRLADDQPVLLPADLCLRRPAGPGRLEPLVNVGTGCAAGPTLEAATMSALLEAVERDAAALWWLGGRSPRPLSLEAAAAAGAEEFLARLRGGVATRQSRLLDITTDIGVPCMAAVSLTADGRGFACGLAAGITIGTAVRSAMLEMCQMELSHQIIALKRRQRGDSALNAHDRAQLERGRTIDADDSIIQPRGASRDWQYRSNPAGTPMPGLADLVERVAAVGACAYAVDCTRDAVAIPVCKVIVTGLQPYPSSFETSRLRCGRGEDHAGPAVPLL